MIKINYSYKPLSLLIVILLGCSWSIVAQEEDLATERIALQKEIQQTTKLLDAARQSKVSAIDGYFALQRQLEQRAKLIRTIQREIRTSAVTMERSAMAVDSLELEIEKLKVEYATMLQQAFRQRESRNDLLFLFSANSFNQALKRWRYIQQYNDYRKKQIQLILETQTSLKEQIAQLESSKNNQEQLLSSEEEEKVAMQTALSYKGTILRQLKAEEQEILTLLRQQKKAHEQLSATVTLAIEEDLDRQTESALDSNTAAKPEKRKSLSADISFQFAKERGKMVWPLQNGIITRYFGNQPHPIHKKILINNNGIDIRARGDQTVYSLFDGLVAAIQIVPGYQNTLILQHGEYYSVYSNLESVRVRKGDIVLAQQAIGMAGIPPQKDAPEVHLEIWKGKKRLNPFGWLKKI